MRIALASPYDFASHGGVNQHIQHVKLEFERLGHEVVVIAPLSNTATYVHSPDFHGFGGIVPISANGSVARLSFSFNLRRRLKVLMETEHFDVVHLHEPLTPALPLAVLNYSRSVNIGTFHAYAESSMAYFYARPVLQRFVDRLDGLIAVSEPAHEYAQQYFNGQWKIIPNGVDISSFTGPAAPLDHLMDGRPNLLFLGRFEEERKGFKYALRALQWVRQSYKDVRLVVVGQGDPERYSSQIDKHGLWQNIVFVGPVSNEDRARYMASCTALVAPNTHGESQGIVLLEAMAAGLPVIAGDIPGYAAIVTNNREGLLVEPESEHSLAIAAVRMLADGDLRARLAAAGSLKAEAYSWPKVAVRILDYYEEVCERKVWDESRGERRQRLKRVFRRMRRA
ncbi:MAG: glycosyltransferase family 4 protein [Chloroflexia bacterium]